MLKILIVEDDAQLATTLKYLVEDNPRYRVVAIADDLPSAVAAAEARPPRLVDCSCARIAVSASLSVSSFLTCVPSQRQPPSFPMPDTRSGACQAFPPRTSPHLPMA